MPASPQSYQLLSEVFYSGLKLRLVSKADITKWADGIIAAATAPNYPFIELSMSKNINEIMGSIGDKTNVSTGPIVGRVLLSLLYHQLNNSNIDLQKACVIMDQIKSMNTLTVYENAPIYQFYDDIQELFRPDDIANLRVEILAFLVTYKDFSLDNYEQWDSINRQIEATFSKYLS